MLVYGERLRVFYKASSESEFAEHKFSGSVGSQVA